MTLTFFFCNFCRFPWWECVCWCFGHVCYYYCFYCCCCYCFYYGFVIAFRLYFMSFTRWRLSGHLYKVTRSKPCCMQQQQKQYDSFFFFFFCFVLRYYLWRIRVFYFIFVLLLLLFRFFFCFLTNKSTVNRELYSSCWRRRRYILKRCCRIAFTSISTTFDCVVQTSVGLSLSLYNVHTYICMYVCMHGYAFHRSVLKCSFFYGVFICVWCWDLNDDDDHDDIYGAAVVVIFIFLLSFFFLLLLFYFKKKKSLSFFFGDFCPVWQVFSGFLFERKKNFFSKKIPKI